MLVSSKYQSYYLGSIFKLLWADAHKDPRYLWGNMHLQHMATCLDLYDRFISWNLYLQIVPDSTSFICT